MGCLSVHVEAPCMFFKELNSSPISGFKCGFAFLLSDQSMWCRGPYLLSLQTAAAAAAVTSGLSLPAFAGVV